MKRPVGSILLGLFLLSQIILQGGRLWPALPAIGRGAPVASGWAPLVPTRVRLALTLPGDLVLRGENGALWRVSAASPTRAEPVAARSVSQELPGGVMVSVELARLGGGRRIVSVEGARAWTSPDGRASALYDPVDRAFWALVASDVRPRPLGAVDPAAPSGLAWSARGDRLAYLSGRPGHLWSWRVGTYAQEIAGAYGRPLAVRADGGLVLGTRNGDPALYLPGVGVAVPVASGRVLAVAPTGRQALIAHGGKVFLTDLESGRASLLPLAPAQVAQAVWDSDGSVAILRRGASGRHDVLVATADGGLRWLRPPAGTSASGSSLVALSGGHLLAVFERGGVAVTYVRSLGGAQA